MQQTSFFMTSALRGVGKNGRRTPLGLGLRRHGRHPGVSRKVGAVKVKRGEEGKRKNARRGDTRRVLLVVITRRECVCARACWLFWGLGGKNDGRRSKAQGVEDGDDEEEAEENEEEGAMYEYFV